MAKKIRVRPNQNVIEKKIKADTIRKLSYLSQGKNSIEFILPKQNPLNQFFFHDFPLLNVSEDGRLLDSGELGCPKYFYITKNEYEILQSLFNEFLMPIEVHNDLTTAFLSMVFAACEVTHKSKFNEEYAWKRKEAQTTLDLLKQFEQNQLLLHAITIEYKEKLGDYTQIKPSSSPPKFKKIKGHIAVQFLEKILKNFSQIKGIDTYERMYQSQKEYGSFDPFMGHMNAEKQFQSYYASVILEYLRPKLFNPLFDLLPNPIKYEMEEKKFKRKHSRRKLSLFIGKLMIQSKLLELKDSTLNESITDNIEKKLYPKFKNEKKKLSEIEENNRIAKNGMIEIIRFDKLF